VKHFAVQARGQQSQRAAGSCEWALGRFSSKPVCRYSRLGAM